ncbi:glycosyltransferase involved in cell wall biosynthesis [Microbacterium sp. SLBN-154]|uniref:glycosyltransferase family 4 protein n=1 Tax=Microbacterium sp. SLBN-154 TaxID=2768458 RepID=UPI00114DEDF5|nr:glycosyltransferase family 4 protein [Microbacterium sp. SLBN-154]TQK18763.1 glycosyltransferase involved in cell wall biosynthesis [Microbacterium sp. SLBN-154]
MTGHAAFAIPGDLDTVTGGYLYEKRLLEGLREVGVDTTYVPLGDSFPDPSEEEVDATLAALQELDPSHPLILDGFVFGAMPTAALARLRAPIVGVVHHPLAHEEGLSPERREYLFTTERDNLQLAAAVLVPSPHTARILVAEYGADPASITVARPGTDPARGVSRQSAPPLILSVGIQHPRKGHDLLMRALARITDLDWHAEIVGTPWDQGFSASLPRLRDDLGLAGRVRLAGGIGDDELDGLWAQASVFALATRYEGYGLVFDEALAWGLPIVSCDTGAVPETVPREAGVLVPPGDPAAFAAALRDLLTDHERRERMTRAARAAGAALPSWLDTARVAQRVLEAVTGRSPTPRSAFIDFEVPKPQH